MIRVLAAIALAFAPFLSTASAAVTCPSIEWSPVIAGSLPSSTNVDLVAVDYDEDGILDLVGAIRDSSSYTPGQIGWWRGTGGGSFSEWHELWSTASSVNGLASGDVTGDGVADLLALTGSQFQLFASTGGGLASPVAYSNPVSAERAVIADVDGDSQPDLVLGGLNETAVLEYRGGTFADTARIARAGQSIAVADFDGDTHPDLALAGSSTVSILYSDATGEFVTLQSLAAGTSIVDLDAVDLDGDSAIDLVALNDTTQILTILRNSGVRQFTASSLDVSASRVDDDFVSVEIADFNADTYPDLFLTSWGGILLTFAGNGDGTFRTPTEQLSPLAKYMTASVIADFDADGGPDAAMLATELSVASPACAPSVTLSSRTPIITFGQSVTLDVRVAGLSATSTPRTVTIKEGAVTLASVNLDDRGRASWSTTALNVGEHVLTATYAGSSGIPASSSSWSQSVTTEITTPVISDPPVPYVFPTTWYVRATVPGSQGWVVIGVDGEEMRTHSGWDVPMLLAPGTHTIDAHFEGDSVNPPGSASREVTVEKATSTLNHNAGSTISRVGTAEPLQFAVNGGGLDPLTGTVTMKEGSAFVTSGAVSAGRATLTPSLSRGLHEVVISYSGDAQRKPSSLTLLLDVLPASGFVLEAHGRRDGTVVISTLPPDGTQRMWLRRRVAGTVNWTLTLALSSSNAADLTPTPGVAYEYMVEALDASDVLWESNVDGALVFSDEPVAARSVVRRTHFEELAAAANLLRQRAGLAPWSFSADFVTPGVIRAAHVNGLRTALAQARAALGMSPVSLPTATAGSTSMLANDVQQLRELTR